MNYHSDSSYDENWLALWSCAGGQCMISGWGTFPLVSGSSGMFHLLFDGNGGAIGPSVAYISPRFRT